MVLTLRLRPVGTKLRKEWSLVAIDHRRPRNSGLFIEEVSYFQLNFQACKIKKIYKTSKRFWS